MVQPTEHEPHFYLVLFVQESTGFGYYEIEGENYRYYTAEEFAIKYVEEEMSIVEYPWNSQPAYAEKGENTAKKELLNRHKRLRNLQV